MGVKTYRLIEFKVYIKTFSPYLACQDASLMPSHYLTLCPGTIQVSSLKPLRNGFCLLRAKSFVNQYWSGGEIQGSVLCFLSEFPTSVAAMRRA